MGRKSKKLEEIPICGFETIAERTKSANKRQSKPPTRFSNEFEYFSKLKVKKERFADEYTPEGIPVKKRRGRPRVIKAEVKCQMSEDSMDSTYGGQPYNYQVFRPSITSSTPKLKLLMKRTMNPIPTMDQMDTIQDSPPKLTAMQPEIQIIEPNAETDIPPILHPIQPLKHSFHQNKELKPFLSLSENKMNGINGTKEDYKKIEGLKREVFDLKRRHDDVVDKLNRQRAIGQQTQAELDKLRAERQQFEYDRNRDKATIISLKQKLAEQTDLFEKDLRDTKKRHWCSVCLKEAKYYCCWVGSYCSENCQNIHWKGSHKKYCRRQSN